MRTPHGGFNRMVVSVTVCEPGTERCVTVDDVMVDTGSTGLRLEASAVPTWLRLPAFSGPNGKPLAECLRFVHDTAWGPLQRADVRLGGLIARKHSLAGPSTTRGAHRRRRAHAPMSVPTSNETLGVGQHLFDCQGACQQRTEAPGVFVWDGTEWSPVDGAVEPAYRLPNPVSYLPGHDNGIVIDLPSPPDEGAREVVGTLTFGVVAGDKVDTAGHPAPRRGPAGSRTMLAGRSYPTSYIDSGTETYVLYDASLPRCRDMPWAYCAEPRRTLRAEMVGTDGKGIPTTFNVGNYQTSRERHAGASDDVAEVADQQADVVIWGAPFFLGRRISLVMDGSSVPGTPSLAGPFYVLD